MEEEKEGENDVVSLSFSCLLDDGEIGIFTVRASGVYFSSLEKHWLRAKNAGVHEGRAGIALSSRRLRNERRARLT